MDGVKAQLFCDRDIRFGIINEEAFTGRTPDPVERHRIDARIRFYHPLFAGQDDGIEPFKEREARADAVKGFRRPVAQAIERVAPLLQRAKYIDRRLNSTADRFFPPFIIRPDEMSMMREPLRELGHCNGKRPPAILFHIPFDKADFIQESRHRFVIVVEKRALKIMRIPIDQDAAKIKDNRRR